MDRQYIDDHHIIARYLADRLTEAEREAFETYYLAHPEVLRDMEAAARFKAGLMQLQESGELATLLKPRPWFMQWQAIAAAAALAAIVIGASLFVASQPPVLAPMASMLETRDGSPLRVVGSHEVFRTRGAPRESEFRLPSAPGAIELRVLPEFPATPPRYRLELSRIEPDAPRTVAKVAGLIAAEDDHVTVYLDSAALQPGPYQIVITGDEDTSAADKSSAFTVWVRGPADSR